MAPARRGLASRGRRSRSSTSGASIRRWGPESGFGVLLGEHGFVLDPGAYLAALGEHARALGAERRQAAATGFRLGPDGAFQAVVTDGGEVEGQRAVIATGAWSKALAGQLGLRVPLESERGYHVMLRDPSLTPRVPTMVASGRFVASPMADGLRCAGIVEFGGLKAPAGRRPVALILEKVREACPDLTFSSHEEWLGHRPAPSDSLPLIGEVPERPGIFLAFGHHHVGLDLRPQDRAGARGPDRRRRSRPRPRALSARALRSPSVVICPMTPASRNVA